jgi:hypothetical protein
MQIPHEYVSGEKKMDEEMDTKQEEVQGGGPIEPPQTQTEEPSGPNWWLIGGIVVVALVILLFAFGVFTGDDKPEEPFITITSPVPGETLPVSETVRIQGQAGGLVGSNAVVVQVLDSDSNPIVEQNVSVSTSQDGGTGNWVADFAIPAEPGSNGFIFVFSPSPQDGSVVVSANIGVLYGLAEEVETEQPDTEEPPTEEPPTEEPPTEEPPTEEPPTEEPPTEEPPEEGRPEDELIGPLWTVEMILPQFVTPVEGVVHELEEPVEGTPEMTLVFKDDDTIEAFGGCNRFEARWEADERELEFEEIRIPGEPSACVEPPGTLDQESHYVSLLERVERYYLIRAGDEVTLILIEVREAENDLEQPLMEFEEP